MMKKSVWLLVTLLLILSLFPLASQAAPLKNLSWRAEYYDNPTLSGQPKISRFEDSVNHDWGYGSPAVEIPVDYFSARYTLTRHFEKGTYLFLLAVDDGARVWLDGDLIIDNWTVGHKDNIKKKVYLEKSGDHELQVAYFEQTQRAMINFSWQMIAGEGEILGAWRGEYFNNRNLDGAPVLTRQDGAINFDWNSGSPSPKVPRDNFSVRWTRSIYLEAGTYKFRIQHDDGMRIFVDDKIIYDSWYDQGITYKTLNVRLERGSHAFRVEYYEHLNNAVAVMIFDGDPGNNPDGGEPDTSDGVIIDNKSSGFAWGGPTSSRYEGWGGCYLSNYYWTYNSSYHPVNSGKWTPNLNAGDYEVMVYIPAKDATTKSARYRIMHNGGRSDRVVNQGRYHNTWVSLGTYYFNGQGQESVMLYDNTGEPTGATKIAFDAVKFVKR